MEGTLKAADLLIKIVIAVVVFASYETVKQRLQIEEQVLKNQNLIIKNMSDENKLQSDKMSLAWGIADKLLQHTNVGDDKCVTEDQSLIIDYMVSVHNSISVVKFPADEFKSNISAKRSCTLQGEKKGQQASNPIIPWGKPFGSNNSNFTIIQKSIADKIASELNLPDNDKTVFLDSKIANKFIQDKIVGFVALGRYSDETGYRNFITKDNGKANKDEIVRARWSVYLRVNTENTETGANKALGIINEGQCLKIFERFDDVRGQSWASVFFAECPDS